MGKKVTIDNLNEEINKILEEYADDVYNNLSIITKRIGQKGAQAIRNEAKKDFNGKKYASGWGVTTEQGRLYTTVIIHNKKQAGLAHLLEHGHVLKNGTGRVINHKNGKAEVDGQIHIEKVEEKLIAEYEREVVNTL